MRTIKISSLLIALILGLTFNSCKDDDPTTGDLVVFAEDISGNPIDGEYIYLYSSQADFNTRTYTLRKVSDSAGSVEFSELAPKTYWVDCDFTNSLGGTTTIDGTGTVDAGIITTITIAP